MPNAPVKLTERNLKEQIEKNLHAIMVDCPSYRLLVGIPGTVFRGKKSIVSVAKSGKNKGKEVRKIVNSTEIFNVAEYAATNEFGSYSKHIPSRPFMRTTFQGESMTMIQKAAWKLLSEMAEVNQNAKDFLEKLGLYIAGRVQKNITNGHFAHNAPYTISKKHSSTPLIDTGTMRRSITAWVTSANKGISNV